MRTSFPGAVIPARDGELLYAYHVLGDRTARERLIERHLPLVRRLAWRYRRSGEPHDDLVQAGCVGLVEAVDRFDLARGTDFLAFAVPTILGEIRRHLRDRGDAVYAPRSVKQLGLTLRRATADLAAGLGRSPTLAELAEHAGTDLEQALEALLALEVQRTLPLEGGPSDDTAENGNHAGLVGAVDRGFALVEERSAVADGLRALDRRERLIVALTFLAGLTQSQIGARLGISQMQVSRLLRAALAKARAAADPQQLDPRSVAAETYR